MFGADSSVVEYKEPRPNDIDGYGRSPKVGPRGEATVLYVVPASHRKYLEVNESAPPRGLEPFKECLWSIAESFKVNVQRSALVPSTSVPGCSSGSDFG